MKEVAASYGWEVFPISAVTGEGIPKLVYYLRELVKMADDRITLRERPEYPVERLASADVDGKSEGVEGKEESRFVIRRENDIFVIEGEEIEQLVQNVRDTDFETLQHLHKRLETLGALDALKEKGIEDGDTVRIGYMEFEYKV